LQEGRKEGRKEACHISIIPMIVCDLIITHTHQKVRASSILLINFIYCIRTMCMVEEEYSSFIGGRINKEKKRGGGESGGI